MHVPGFGKQFWQPPIYTYIYIYTLVLTRAFNARDHVDQSLHKRTLTCSVDILCQNYCHDYRDQA